MLVRKAETPSSFKILLLPRLVIERWALFGLAGGYKSVS
jgi:hypothetical protein